MVTPHSGGLRRWRWERTKMTPHPIDSTHPVVTLFPHASMNTLAALARELSSAEAPTDRRVAPAAALTAYPSDSTTWDCLTRARADRDPAVAAAARSALETIFTA